MSLSCLEVRGGARRCSAGRCLTWGATAGTSQAATSSTFQDSSNNDDYDYDAGEFDDRSSQPRATGSSGRRRQGGREAAAAKAPPPKQPEVNLFDFDDDEPAAPMAAPAPPVKASAPSADAFDGEHSHHLPPV